MRLRDFFAGHENRIPLWAVSVAQAKAAASALRVSVSLIEIPLLMVKACAECAGESGNVVEL